MKNLFLLWLLIYVITGNVAFAEKAMSPVLLTPSNFAKSISKDSIKFTWQNAQNEVNAKVNGYRIIISENSQFNGYSPSTGRCNITCMTNVINGTIFSTALRLSNKTYYWRVQGISTIENGEWSRTGTFKTDVPVPSITNANATPSSVTQGSTLIIAATLSGLLPSNYSVKINDNGNLSAMNGSGTSYSLSQSPSIIGSRNYSIGVYDINNNLKSSLFNGSYEIKKPNAAPTLNFISGNTTATTGTTYTIQLQGHDADNNLSSITIYWGDSSSNSQNASSGSTLTFTHTYNTANSYTWSATAYDLVNANSDNLTRNVIITKANTAPTLSFISGNTIATTGTTYAVQLQGNDADNNLSQITINWGDGSSNSQNAASGSALTFSHTYFTANSYTWSATAYDSVNASSDNVAKTVTVSTPIVIPSISSASASPTSTTLGNSINFSATLSGNLPSGYSVKLSYSNTSISMSGSGTNYNVVQTPTLLGQQVFTVGVYDANNNLKGNAFTSNFEIVKANSVPTLSFISGNTTATAGTSYSVQLQAIDADNNLKSITVVWGDGATDTQNATNGTTLTFTHTYATANTYNWSATALDSGNASSIAIAKSVTVSATVVAPHVSLSGYTKISNTGVALPDTALLGSGPNDWACTKDNKTGLTWEVKTDDGGLRDKDWYYSWYKPSGDNGGNAGYTDTFNTPNCSTQNNCNTDAFTNAVNTQGLCGKKDWRMPTKDELMKLVVCSDGKYKADGSCTNPSSVAIPTINSTYFPNTSASGMWWSSLPYGADNSSYAFFVGFYGGYFGSDSKYGGQFVRLVREETPPTTSAYTKISNSGTALPDTAVLGNSPNDWACTKDNKTGLTWEVKTTDGGLRDKSKTYSNYNYTASESDNFVSTVNKTTLCGMSNWRLPNNEELKGLVSCSDGQSNSINKDSFGNICTNYLSVAQPTINSVYFPNTQSYGFWSSSLFVGTNNVVWGLNFGDSNSISNYMSFKLFIRLVSG